MNKLQSLKLRLYVAFMLLIGKYEANDEIARTEAKDEALRQALAALAAIGQRPRGGSRHARATHMFLTTQLQGVGVVL